MLKQCLVIKLASGWCRLVFLVMKRWLIDVNFSNKRISFVKDQRRYGIDELTRLHHLIYFCLFLIRIIRAL